jgi:CRISPR-associated protein Cmr6
VLAYCLEETPGGRDEDGGKRATMKLAAEAVGRATPIYEMAYRRWAGELSADARTVAESMAAPWRIVIGLGNENILEAGITLHRTYGTPLIPGSALKGLAAHYCAEVWGAADAEYSPAGAKYRALFGAAADAGHITFHDALIAPDALASGLVLDAITPHHGDYYGGGAYGPTDFDDPKPVPFLAVKGKFHVAVTCDGEPAEAVKWAKLTLQLLKQALEEWGVGGKTNSGYGRLND